MPDEDGKLTDRERQQVTTWIWNQAKGVVLRCPMCQSTNWVVAKHLVQLRAGDAHVQLISNPCGYVRWMDATMIGLVPPRSQ
jgi:hypothetical protein